MNDRELLLLAAKAAGLVVVDDSPAVTLYVRADGCHGGVRWNPLADSGDALNLAASLRLQIKPGKHPGDGCEVDTQRRGIAGAVAFLDDKSAQMRRAIVITAAEIGRSLS